jgi:hypothetical protein
MTIRKGYTMDARNLRIVTGIFEARYQPKIKATEIFGLFEEQCGEEYHLKEYDPVRVLLSNHDETNQKFLSIENSGITHIPFTDKHNFIDECKETLKFATELVGVTTFKRLGIRTEMVLPVKENEMSKETLNFILKLFGNNATKQLGKAVGNFNLNIGTIDDKFNHTFSFQFAARDENAAKSLKDIPKQGLIVEVDCYKEGDIRLNDASSFVEDAIDSSVNKLRNFLSSFLIRSEK